MLIRRPAGVTDKLDPDRALLDDVGCTYLWGWMGGGEDHVIRRQYPCDV